MADDKADGGDAPNHTLLLDLAQSLGRIEGQNQMILQEQSRAADGRRDQYRALDEIREDLRKVKSTADTVASRMTVIEPDVKNMKAFRAQLALAVFFVTSAVTGAINLLWLAITHLGEIKSALREFLK
jgi:hypothetical protein